MKVLISADMEGSCGIAFAGQVDREDADYAAFRLEMTRDVNAAVAGAFEGGATEVVVTDAHDRFTNIRLADLDPRASLISGPDHPLSMVHGLEGADVAFFTGYHARMGTAGAVLDHTYFSICHRITLNGREVGEAGINAAVAGHFGVPVGLVTGDLAVCREAGELLGCETAAVKEGLARNSALLYPAEKAREEIRRAAARAVARAGEMKPLVTGSPCVIEVEFHLTQMADAAALCPWVERTGPRSLRVTADDVLTAYRGLLVILTLAAGRSEPS